jgi:hypothetical protein
MPDRGVVGRGDRKADLGLDLLGGSSRRSEVQATKSPSTGAASATRRVAARTEAGEMRATWDRRQYTHSATLRAAFQAARSALHWP